MIDKNGKLFGKINLLDLLFVLGIVAVMVFGYFYFSKDEVGTNKVYFTVEFRNMRKDYADKIHKGDEIKDSIRDNYLGVVYDIQVLPEEFIVWSIEEQKFVKTLSDEEYSIRVKIEANGSKTDADIFAEAFPVKVGKDISIKGKGYANSGYIVSVTYEEEAK